MKIPTAPTVAVLSFLLFFVNEPARAAGETAGEVLDRVVQANGGLQAWSAAGNLVIREERTQFAKEGNVQSRLTHFYHVATGKYRIEIQDPAGTKLYGWDGKKFWAVVNGKPGDEKALAEARSAISNDRFRFSLPFELNRKGAEITYEGKEKVKGAETDKIKAVYREGPTAQHQQESGLHSKGHGHASSEIYYFSFAQPDLRLVEMRFSHHGDPNEFETMVLEGHKTEGGIRFPFRRELFLHDGSRLWSSTILEIRHGVPLQDTVFNAPGQPR